MSTPTQEALNGAREAILGVGSDMSDALKNMLERQKAAFDKLLNQLNEKNLVNRKTRADALVTGLTQKDPLTQRLKHSIDNRVHAVEGVNDKLIGTNKATLDADVKEQNMPTGPRRR